MAGGLPHPLQPPVFRIAAERLVAAVARQRHSDMLARHARNEIGRQLRGVRERLVEPVGNIADQRKRGVGLEHDFGVVGLKMPSNGARGLRFIVSRVAETDGKGTGGALGHRLHHRDNGRRIGSAGQEGADRNVGDQAALDTIAQQRFECGGRLLE